MSERLLVRFPDSGSATIVNGKPRIVIPAVFFKPEDKGSCPETCEDADTWHCMLSPAEVARCAMTYVISTPTNLSDSLLGENTRKRSPS